MNYLLNISSSNRPGWRIFAALAVMLAIVSGFTQTTNRTAPEAFLPAPLRLPPCDGFDFKAVPSTRFFISKDFRIAENQTFAVASLNARQHGFNFVNGFNLVPSDRLNNVVAWGMFNAFVPSAIHLRDIEAHKANLRVELAMIDRIAGSVELSSSSPDFAVQMLAVRELLNKPAWSPNDVSGSCPELSAIPVSSTTVELLRRHPAAHILPARIKVPAQCHFAFVHGMDATVTTFDCKALYSS